MDSFKEIEGMRFHLIKDSQVRPAVKEHTLDDFGEDSLSRPSNSCVVEEMTRTVSLIRKEGIG